MTTLKAVYINTTLKRSPEVSNTAGLIERSRVVLEKAGVSTTVIRAVDHNIAPGIDPDMRENGWEEDAWPELWPLINEAEILILAGPIWLGDQSSESRKIIERLYAHSGQTNDKGQYVFYGKVAGTLVTGNEDGVKHVASNVLYSLQHIGYTIPPQADAGWIGAVGPGPSYLDEGSGGPESDFTNRNLTFMAHNLVHLATMLNANGGIPAEGNVPSEWNDGKRFGFEQNPEYR
ncbi:BRAMP protein [Leifsonia rubra CMS 76R]|nr:BRAMP protein [Leifsonia rubra CMS 76R]